MAAAASAIGAVGVIAGKNKSKKEAASVSMEGVDEQLAKARQKLNLIENEQEMIQSSLSE